MVRVQAQSKNIEDEFLVGSRTCKKNCSQEFLNGIKLEDKGVEATKSLDVRNPEFRIFLFEPIL